MNKLCTKCRETKPVNAFSKNKRRRDGLASWCKQCVTAYNLEHKTEQAAQQAIYRAEHKTKIDAYNAAYYLEHKAKILAYKAIHKERIAARVAERKTEIAAYQTAYQTENAARLAAYRASRKAIRAEQWAAYYMKNQAKLIAASATYKAQHKAEQTAYAYGYRRTPRGRLATKLSKMKRHRAMKQGDLKACQIEQLRATQLDCYLCGSAFGPELRSTIDHVHPLSKGGLHTISNIKLACTSCNCSKRATVMPMARE